MQSSFFSGPHPVIRGAVFSSLPPGCSPASWGSSIEYSSPGPCGPEQVGAFVGLIFPVYGVLCAASSSGIQTAISRLTAAEASSGADTRFLRCGLFTALLLASLGSAGASGLRRIPLQKHCWESPGAHALLRALAFCVPLSSIHACISGFYYGLMRAAVTVPVPAGGTECPDAVYFHGLENQPAGGDCRCRCPPPCGRWGPESWLRRASLCLTAMGMKTPQGNHSDVRSRSGIQPPSYFPVAGPLKAESADCAGFHRLFRARVPLLFFTRHPLCYAQTTGAGAPADRQPAVHQPFKPPGKLPCCPPDCNLTATPRPPP